jgi:hypothetical protein
VIKGEGVPQKYIWKLFGQMMEKSMIFYGNMLPVVILRLCFIIQGIDAMTKYAQLRNMGFKLFVKL